MGLEYNHLIINGRSSADLPFLVAVETNAAPVKAKKKNIHNELEHVNGLVVQTIDAWEAIEKKYTFYLYDVSMRDMRLFKKFLGNTGEFTPYNDPDIHFNFYAVEFVSETQDLLDGYHDNYKIEVTFLCEPFEYEKERWVTNLQSLSNFTNAPMWPRLKLYGNTSGRQSLTIGNQTISLTEGIKEFVEIECKHGHQTITDNFGYEINRQMVGPFFTIPIERDIRVIKTSGITRVDMLQRWGWE